MQGKCRFNIIKVLQRLNKRTENSRNVLRVFPPASYFSFVLWLQIFPLVFNRNVKQAACSWFESHTSGSIVNWLVSLYLSSRLTSFCVYFVDFDHIYNFLPRCDAHPSSVLSCFTPDNYQRLSCKMCSPYSTLIILVVLSTEVLIKTYNVKYPALKE